MCMTSELRTHKNQSKTVQELQFFPSLCPVPPYGRRTLDCRARMHLLNGTPLIQKTSHDKHGAKQNEKVIIFRYLRGVTTDLQDTE